MEESRVRQHANQDAWLGSDDSSSFFISGQVLSGSAESLFESEVDDYNTAQPGPTGAGSGTDTGPNLKFVLNLYCWVCHWHSEGRAGGDPARTFVVVAGRASVVGLGVGRTQMDGQATY